MAVPCIQRMEAESDVNGTDSSYADGRRGSLPERILCLTSGHTLESHVRTLEIGGSFSGLAALPTSTPSADISPSLPPFPCSLRANTNVQNPTTFPSTLT